MLSLIVSIYVGLTIKSPILTNRSGQMDKLTFSVVYPKGNKSPQPELVLRKTERIPGTQVYKIVGTVPTHVKGFLKVFLSGAVEGTCIAHYHRHPLCDEGGNTTWHAYGTFAYKSMRAGTVYMNVFDDAGHLISSTTFQVDKSGNS